MQHAAEMLGFLFENLVTIFALVVLLELGFCYTLQTIADKQDVAHSWLAWVPLLQLHPLLRSGGASSLSFLGLLAAGIAAIILGALIGPLGGLLALAWAGWALIFFGRVFWNTAENRHVSGWIGLLAFLPLINFFAYLYIAFHDGPVAPSRLGVVLGVILIVLPAYPELRKARELGELGRQFGPMAAAAEQGDDQTMTRLMYGMVQKMQTMEGFEAPEGDPDAMSRMLEQLSEAMGTNGESAVGDDGRSAAPPLEAPELESISPYFECPEGTREGGAAPPLGFERWCEWSDPARGEVRHGGYASWHRNAGVHETGAFVSGKREGVWTRWNERGRMQTQAEFEDGLQHGFQIDWDESGTRLREIRFARGEPVGR
jgi:hypothetical protein